MNTYTGKEGSELAYQKYKEHISNLQFRNIRNSCFHLYEGFWYRSNYLEQIMLNQDNFCAKPTDIFICSFMKSGTTWLKALTFAIVTRTKFKISSNPLLTTMPHYCVPYLEYDLIPNSPFERDLELPLLSTHIPYTSLPKSIITSGCKIVYIYRDPKDVFVSLWHFLQPFFPEDMVSTGMFNLFDHFLEGLVDGGPIWEHVLSYWKASLERPGKVLLLKYEDLINNTEFYVNKLAEFVECPFSVDEKKEKVMEKLIKLCDIENLKNLDVNKKGKYVNSRNPLVIDNKSFFRKGKSGDWKNYLTREMADKIDKITEEKFGSSGLIIPISS